MDTHTFRCFNIYYFPYSIIACTVFLTKNPKYHHFPLKTFYMWIRRKLGYFDRPKYLISDISLHYELPIIFSMVESIGTALNKIPESAKRFTHTMNQNRELAESVKNKIYKKLCEYQNKTELPGFYGFDTEMAVQKIAWDVLDEVNTNHNS